MGPREEDRSSGAAVLHRRPLREGCLEGLFITTAGFSQAAREYAEKLNSQKLVLVDGNALASLMIDYGVGVSTVATFEVKSIDTDFFTGE